MSGPAASRYMAVMLVTDLPRSIAFYTKALGLREHDCFRNIWAEIWCGEQLLALWNREGSETALLPQGARPGAGGTFVAIKTDNLADSLRAIQEHGGTIEAPAKQASHGQMALAHDPDGNPLLLHQPHRPLPGW